MNKYQIHIEKYPTIVINITQEQLDVIEVFANIRRDENLNKVYKLNDCEFRVLQKHGKSIKD